MVPSYMCNASDSELVDEIVADVREKLYPTGTIGFYSRFLGIENLLRKQSHDIYRLGVWGTPGVGKTTIAQTAFNLMSQDFEAHCFLEDFHVNFQEKGLYKLREEHFIEKLKRTTVLIVLDDVRNPMEAESFLGGYDCFGLASLIIIISRDKQILYQCQVQGFFEVTSLNKKEGLQLFNQFAFPEKEPSDSNLVEVSKKVVELLKIYSSSSEPSQELYLPKGLESLPYELKLLHWEYYPLQSLPQDFDPSHLVEINLPYSQLQYLWAGTKSLAKLKIINLSHSQKLVEVDELSKACSLKEIVLKGCTTLERSPRIDQLKNLELLDLSCCTRIKRTESLAKLKIINLSHSQKLVEVDELSKACSLKEIVLKGCTTLERSPRIDQLKNLELLDLSCCTRIKRTEVIEMIKPLDTGGLREIESGSMVFST
ncbi:hypothetical protein F2Q70_00031356 [Brassica cretica]|uniref:NB-ARC domain-containing protein n=1 Tax=Brassica cretica TaxID=69181 RepID=A0A8S9FMG6_BRACR|nr:hypothetical protein F2Q70_00031356 [Brassica cretica]